MDPNLIHQIESDEKIETIQLEEENSEDENSTNDEILESFVENIEPKASIDPAIIECEHKIDEMMEAANERAKEILQEAHELALKEAEGIKEEAFRQGYSEGNEQRFIELWEELGSVETFISEMVNQHQERYSEYMRNVDVECKVLAVSIAEKILMKKIEIDENEMLTMIEEGIKNLKKFKYGEIEISQQCVTLVNTLQGKLREAGYETMEVKKVNASLGTCILTSDLQRVDMSITKQLENILKMIKG